MSGQSETLRWWLLGGLLLVVSIAAVALLRKLKSIGAARWGSRRAGSSARGDSDGAFPFASSFASGDDHVGSHHGHHHTDGGGTGHDGGGGDGGGWGDGGGGAGGAGGGGGGD